MAMPRLSSRGLQRAAGRILATASCHRSDVRISINHQQNRFQKTNTTDDLPRSGIPRETKAVQDRIYGDSSGGIRTRLPTTWQETLLARMGDRSVLVGLNF